VSTTWPEAWLVTLTGPQLELLPKLDEGAAPDAGGSASGGRGSGITAVAKRTLESCQIPPDRAGQSRSGGGRMRLAEADPALVPGAAGADGRFHSGDPESPLVWTTKSAAKRSAELTGQGTQCSPQTA
jgi:hypothetical protein